MLLLSSSLKSRGIAASILSGLCVLSASSCGSTNTMRIVDVDGPAVVVVPWPGAPTITVECGATRAVDTASAPNQPWRITVRALTTHRLLLQQSGTGDLEVIVRSGGVLIGQPAPSVGPAGIGCTGG